MPIMRLFGEQWRRKRFIRPNALFLGIACSFVACCMAGRSSSQRNPFHDFERFHAYLNPSTYFYPTASQVRELGRAKLPKDKIAVVVGGSSILYGTGQPPAEVWTRKLQDQLGDDYCVLNLGLWGSLPHEFGAIAAEMLAADHPRLICVTVSHPGSYANIVDGANHRYFFWDAYCKGLLQSDTKRDQAVEQLITERHNLPEFAELHTGAQINSWCWFNDLWNDFTYNYAGTVWNKLMADNWYLPRRLLHDPEPPTAPLNSRYSKEMLDIEMKTVRVCLNNNGCIKDAEGRWVDDPASPVWSNIRESSQCCFPEQYRKRTLMVVATESPYYLNRLTTDEHDLYFTLSRLTAKKLEETGFAAIDMGNDFTPEDFRDRPHLATSGGAILAVKVASRIRLMADELGFNPATKGEKP